MPANDESRRLAWIGIFQSVFIALGASIFGVGMSIHFIAVQLLGTMIDTKAFPEASVKVLEYLNSWTILAIVLGLFLMIGGIVGARIGIFNKKRFKE